MVCRHRQPVQYCRRKVRNENANRREVEEIIKSEIKKVGFIREFYLYI